MYCRKQKCKHLALRWPLGKVHGWLSSRLPAYHAWHHRQHRHFNGLTTAATVIVVVSLILNTIFSGPVLAGSQAFTFASSGDYSFDSATTEVTSNTVRLLSKQYTGSEANTAAYWNLDETAGNSANDGGASNNDLTYSTTSPCAGATWSAGKVVTVGVDRSTYGATTLGGNAGCVSAADSASLSLSSQVTLEAYAQFTSAFDSTNTITQGVLDKGNPGCTLMRRMGS